MDKRCNKDVRGCGFGFLEVAYMTLVLPIRLSWVEHCPPNSNVQAEPVNVTFLAKRVFAGVIS